MDDLSVCFSVGGGPTFTTSYKFPILPSQHLWNRMRGSLRPVRVLTRPVNLSSHNCRGSTNLENSHFPPKEEEELNILEKKEIGHTASQSRIKWPSNIHRLFVKVTAQDILCDSIIYYRCFSVDSFHFLSDISIQKKNIIEGGQ